MGAHSDDIVLMSLNCGAGEKAENTLAHKKNRLFNIRLSRIGLETLMMELCYFERIIQRLLEKMLMFWKTEAIHRKAKKSQEH